SQSASRQQPGRSIHSNITPARRDCFPKMARPPLFSGKKRSLLIQKVQDYLDLLGRHLPNAFGKAVGEERCPGIEICRIHDHPGMREISQALQGFRLVPDDSQVLTDLMHEAAAGAPPMSPFKRREI